MQSSRFADLSLERVRFQVVTARFAGSGRNKTSGAVKFHKTFVLSGIHGNRRGNDFLDSKFHY